MARYTSTLTDAAYFSRQATAHPSTHRAYRPATPSALVRPSPPWSVSQFIPRIAGSPTTQRHFGLAINLRGAAYSESSECGRPDDPQASRTHYTQVFRRTAPPRTSP